MEMGFYIWPEIVIGDAGGRAHQYCGGFVHWWFLYLGEEERKKKGRG